ncbi:MAG: BNR-4 repeat-containing protein, partial [Mycobacteriaceae bacterium]|nr:BNR-4 repeat-containing protein [Mycobacteriaceae bacterium]
MHQDIRGSDGFTYPNPVLVPAERDRLYLFWRGADWSADFASRKPGSAFRHAKELIRSPGERPYVKVADNGFDRIAIAFTNGHPRNVLTSVYYASYRHGSLWRAGGRWDHSPRLRAHINIESGRRLRRRQDAGPGLGSGRCSRPTAAAGDRVRHLPESHPAHLRYASFDGRPLGVAPAGHGRRVDQPGHDRVRILGAGSRWTTRTRRSSTCRARSGEAGRSSGERRPMAAPRGGAI